MYLSLSNAAKLAQVSRATLYKRNKQGKLSFHINELGQKVIDAAELSRLYILRVDAAATGDVSTSDASRLDILQVRLDAAQEKIELLEHQVDHLQNTLQHEQNHVTKLLSNAEVLMLTQEPKPKTLLQKIKAALRII